MDSRRDGAEEFVDENGFDGPLGPSALGPVMRFDEGAM